jgi:signal transduction histidine kinase
MQEQKDAEKKAINDNFYDARLKRYSFRGRKQTVIVFSNVSAAKQLQQERVIKEFSRIMTASNYHEFRTPIGAGLNALMLLKSSIPPEHM